LSLRWYITRLESPWIVTRPGGRELRYFRMWRTPAYSATLLDMALPLPTTPCSLKRTVPFSPLITTPKLAVPPGLTGSQAPSNQARRNPRNSHAPPHACCESINVQVLPVRKLVVRYTRPRSSPFGQFCGMDSRHIRTGSPFLDSATAATLS